MTESRPSTRWLDRSKLTPKVCGAEPHRATQLLENDHVVSREVTKILDHEQSKALLKKRRSFHAWEENIFQPTREGVAGALNEQYDHYHASKNELFDRYLTTVRKRAKSNKNNHVFLDVISPDYDALTLQRDSIRAIVKTGRDPTKVHQRRSSLEFSILCTDPVERRQRNEYQNTLQLANFPPQSLSKNTEWKTIVLNDIGSVTRKRAQRKMNSVRLQSQFNNPVEFEWSEGTRRLFPAERSLSFIPRIFQNTAQ